MAGIAGALSQVGIAKESTWGTAVTATALLPVTSVSTNDSHSRAQDTGMRGTMAATTFATYATTRYAEVTLQGVFFPGAATVPACGHLLMAAFGTDTSTGAGPYVHTFSVAPATYALPSYTITVFDGNSATAKSYPGMRLASLKMNFKVNEPITYDAKFVGKVYALVTKPTLTDPTNNAALGYTAAYTIGGSANARFTDFSLNLTRGTKPQFTMANSQDPADIIFDGIDGDFSGTALWDDLTDSDRVKNASGGSIVVTVGTGTPNLVFTATAPSWDVASPKRSVNDVLTVDFSGKLVYSATDAGIIKPVLTNSYATAY